MKIQRPKWYTIDQLADLWDVHKDMITYFIQTEQLKASSRYIHEDDIEDKWTTCHHRDKMNPPTGEERTHLTGFHE